MVNEVDKGSAFRVNLPENHTDGYIWQLNSDFDHSVLEEQNSVWHGDKKGIDFNFKALAVGQTTLHLIKRKYTDTAEVTSFIVKIVSN
jgi:predicted secreted protein